DGRIYAVGGVARGRQNTGALEVFDPPRDRWEARAPMAVPRDHHAAGAVDGKLYVVGGRLGGDYGRNLDAHEGYDPAADTWGRRAPLPTARSGIAAAVLGRRLYVFGGEAPSGTFRQVEAYEPEGDRWVTLTPMPTGRHGLAAIAHEGRIHVISGGPRPGGSFSALNEVFTP
ncbi:MAG: galactose oxidase, partial [Candidatus Rokubacteria bacterium]|nr:galactose oxidase [Candidatus Rokubacteria bacterium]